MSKILVIGANGFIGRNIVSRLTETTDHEIYAYDRFVSYQKSGDNFFSNYPNVNIIVGDFLNRSNLDDTLNGIDIVFHLVSATTPAVSNADPFIDIDTNIKASVELFDLCAKNGVKKVIFISSGGTVYGDTEDGSITEDEIPRPKSPYGIGKLTIEHYLRYFKDKTGLDYIVYRVANPYGPQQKILGQQGVIPIFMNIVLHNKPVVIYGDGSMTRDYIYIDDVVGMILASFDKANKYSEYNIGSGNGSSVNDIVYAIENIVGREIAKEYKDLPTSFVKRSVLDISRFTSEFGYMPSMSLEDGLKKTWEYVKNIN